MNIDKVAEDYARTHYIPGTIVEVIRTAFKAGIEYSEKTRPVCKNCKHYKDGFCTNKKITDGFNFRCGDGQPIDEHEDFLLFTDPNFGCLFHEDKDGLA